MLGGRLGVCGVYEETLEGDVRGVGTNGVEGGEPSEEDPPRRSKSRAFESKVLLSIDSKLDGLAGLISDEVLLDEESCLMLSFQTSQR